MDDGKVWCPYCGWWNGQPEGVEMKEDETGRWFSCPVCRTMSPMGRDPRDARERAQRRFEPLQKPLGIDGLFRRIEPVWLEHNRRGSVVHIANLSRERDDRDNCRAQTIGGVWDETLPLASYGREWRAWGRNPSEYERKKAKWEK